MTAIRLRLPLLRSRSRRRFIAVEATGLELSVARAG